MRAILKVLIGLVILSVAGFMAWYYQPWSRYSPAKVAALQDPQNYRVIFQNFDDYLPARTVSASATPRALETDIKPMFDSFTFKGDTISVSDFHAMGESSAIVVLKDGVVVHEDYFNGADAATRNTSWSVAKSVVATAIFMALEEGRIKSLDDKAEVYAPQYKGTDFGNSSLRSLLAMSTGMLFDEDYNKPKSDIRNFFFDAFIARKDVDSLLFPYGRNREEFADFQYISPNSQVLSAVLRGIYGKPLASIVTEKVWQPLGMADDAVWAMHRPGEKGVAMGYCCLNATAKDYARFGQFWMETVKGEGLGTIVLPDEAATFVTVPPTDDHKPDTGKYGGRGYTHHFWLPPSGDNQSPEQEFFAAGVYGQYIWIDAARGIVIARNAADPAWGKKGRLTFALFREIAKHYGEQ